MNDQIFSRLLLAGDGRVVELRRIVEWLHCGESEGFLWWFRSEEFVLSLTTEARSSVGGSLFRTCRSLGLNGLGLNGLGLNGLGGLLRLCLFIDRRLGLILFFHNDDDTNWCLL